MGILITASEDEIMDAYIKKVAEKRKIPTEKIKGIKKVDFNSLPKEVDFSNIEKNNIEIYEVNYEDPTLKQDENLFVITYSAKTEEPVVSINRQFLNYGFNGEYDDSVILNTGTGVEGSYVMMRKGSITGISTNMEIMHGNGEVEIIIYKNNNPVGFRNTIYADSLGIKKDYDTQSKDIVNFEEGDVISLYLNVKGDVTWKNPVSIVEIIT
jgi:hypothetical protein